MPIMLKTSQVAKLFSKSPMTIGRWVDTFGAYLSHTAKSTDSTERRFSDDDLRVLALVWMMREQGNEFELITAALAAGERADAPQSPSTITTPNNQALALTARVTALEAELNSVNGENRLLKGQNAELQSEIRKLEREIGRLLGPE